MLDGLLHDLSVPARTRGSRSFAGVLGWGLGSIPAHTGEACIPGLVHSEDSSLSPPHTGKPHSWRVHSPVCTVYPRTHGAAGFARSVALSIVAANLHTLGVLLQRRERRALRIRRNALKNGKRRRRAAQRRGILGRPSSNALSSGGMRTRVSSSPDQADSRLQNAHATPQKRPRNLFWTRPPALPSPVTATRRPYDSPDPPAPPYFLADTILTWAYPRTHGEARGCRRLGRPGWLVIVVLE